MLEILKFNASVLLRRARTLPTGTGSAPLRCRSLNWQGISKKRFSSHTDRIQQRRGKTPGSGGSISENSVVLTGAPDGSQTLRWIGYGICMFLLGLSSNNLNENLETLNIWPVEKEFEEIYESFFKSYGWCPYDFALLTKEGEMLNLNKGSQIYEAGEFEGKYCYLLAEGTALFVLASEEDLNAARHEKSVLEPESGSGTVLDSNSQGSDHLSVEEEAGISSNNPSASAVDDSPRIEESLPQAYLCYGYIVKGQFDSLLTRSYSQTSTVTDKKVISGASKSDRRDASNPIPIPITARTSLVAASDVKVLRIPRDKIRSLLSRPSRLSSAAAAIDAARQDRARIILSIEHANAMKQVAEYEDLVAKRLIQLLKM